MESTPTPVDSNTHPCKRQKKGTPSLTIRTRLEVFVLSSSQRNNREQRSPSSGMFPPEEASPPFGKSSSSSSSVIGRDASDLLRFLHRLGLDTRVGLVCCAPVTICKRPCLLVSLRLVGIVAKALLPRDDLFRRMTLPRLNRDPEELRQICSNFFPFDPDMDMRRAADRHLPLRDPLVAIGKNIYDDLYALDFGFVAKYWNGEDQHHHHRPSAVVILREIDKIIKAARFIEASPLSLTVDKRNRSNKQLVTFGHSVPREAIDVAACQALCASTLLDLQPGFHICCGWRQVGARMRSVAEIEHDDWFGFSVGAAELKADRSVPFPLLDISSKSPLAPLGRFPPEVSNPHSSLSVRVDAAAEWLANDGEALRILETTIGRAFAEDNPGIEALRRLRAIASSRFGRPV
jgi:hypothetical protein